MFPPAFSTEDRMNPLVVLVQELFAFLSAAPFGKFLSFLLFLLLMFGLYRLDSYAGLLGRPFQ
jgi:hypothetical protein